MNTNADPKAEVEEWRRRIDQIDDQLVRLINSRSACALEIGRLKKLLQLPVYSPEREAAVLAHVEEASRGPLEAAAVRRVFERIIDESRRLERLAIEKTETATAPQSHREHRDRTETDT